MYIMSMQVAPKAPVIKRVKPGMVIKVKIEEGAPEIRYKIKKVFPRCVIAVDKQGNRRGFSYGDLIIRGMEVQEPKIEALRKAGYNW